VTAAPAKGSAASARAILAAVAALLLAAAWLWAGVMPVAASVERWATHAAAGEALFTLLIFGPILLLALLLGRIACVSVLSPGLEPLRSASIGAGVGLAALALATGYLTLAGTVRFGTPASTAWLLPGVLVIGFQVLAEEALFRGLVQPALMSRFGAPAAIMITAAVFAALHLMAAGAGGLALLNLFLGGLLFGALAWRGQGIAAASAAHAAWNAGEQLLFGLDPNPGTGAFGAWWNLDAVGAARWGGSAEGLNASWAMSLALLAVTLPRLLPLLHARRAVAVDHVTPRAEAR
jgi:membrane protease YdiL (CAAX protease family)